MSSKVSVFYQRYNPDSLQVSIEDLIRKLPDHMHARALRYRSKEAAINYIQGRLLLTHGLQFLGIEEDLANITTSSRGKPSLANTSFNISHSGCLAVCAFVDQGVLGIDIEIPQLTQLDHLKHNFTELEWQRIQSDEHSPKVFYDLWCRKESILKAVDCTLIELHQAAVDSRLKHIDFKGTSFYLKDIQFEGYDDVQGAICTSTPISEIQYIPCELGI